MEKTTAKVDSGDVGRDVINQSAIGQYRPSASGQAKRTGIDGCDETATKKDASRGGPIEKVILTKRANQLQNHKRDGKADSFSDAGCLNTFPMTDVGIGRKLDEGLKEDRKCHRSKS